jgi:transcriptional regulator with XRE-family HTH domain
MPTNADLGRAIRRLRKNRRLTIEALAFAADMHPTYLSGIERGVRNPTWDKIRSVVLALNVPLAVFVRIAEDEAAVAHAVREARARAR